MAVRIVPNGAPAPSSVARPGPSDEVTLPRSTVCELVFVVAQLRGRLEKLAGAHPSRIDEALIGNARMVCTNARAALELSRERDRR